MTVGDLRTAGLSRRQVQTLVARGWLIERHASVYAVGYVPRSRESRWHAAVLALEDAVLSHRAAGALWEIVKGAVPTEVTVPRTTGHRKRDGIIVHRAPLPEAHVATRDGIPVTSLLRTMLDLGAVLRTRPLGWAFEEAQVRYELPPEVVAAELLCRRGYRGTGRLKQILVGAVDPAGVRSILELRFLRLCAAHGIPRPLVNHREGRWTPDFLWPEYGLVVETDGAAFHRTAAKQERDAEKERDLALNGLTTVRLGWSDVTARPAATASFILEALHDRGLRHAA